MANFKILRGLGSKSTEVVSSLTINDNRQYSLEVIKPFCDCNMLQFSLAPSCQLFDTLGGCTAVWPKQSGGKGIT
mgnify:FL=1